MPPKSIRRPGGDRCRREGRPGEIDALAAKTFSTNGLFGSRAQLKTNYLQRDVGAMKGLYGNSLEEAWYGGYVCNGSKPSTVHFTKADCRRPNSSGRSRMYTIPERFLYANPINRYSIGDRTKGLQYGKDGSLTIYVEQRLTRQGQGEQLAAGAGGENAASSPASTGPARRR